MGPFLGLPLPLLPLQILWINLVTDGPPALALSAEPAERGTMRRPPHPPDKSVFARNLGRHVLWVGVLMALVSLGVGIFYSRTAPEIWQTMVFTTLTLSQMSHVMAIRAGDESLFKVGLLSNTPLLGAVAFTIVLQDAGDSKRAGTLNSASVSITICGPENRCRFAPWPASPP